MAMLRSSRQSFDFRARSHDDCSALSSTHDRVDAAASRSSRSHLMALPDALSPRSSPGAVRSWSSVAGSSRPCHRARAAHHCSESDEPCQYRDTPTRSTARRTCRRRPPVVSTPRSDQLSATAACRPAATAARRGARTRSGRRRGQEGRAVTGRRAARSKIPAPNPGRRRPGRRHRRRRKRGRGQRGNGTGRGRIGSGRGGGGFGGGIGSEARLVSGGLVPRDYRRLRAFNAPDRPRAAGNHGRDRWACRKLPGQRFKRRPGARFDAVRDPPAANALDPRARHQRHADHVSGLSTSPPGSASDALAGRNPRRLQHRQPGTVAPVDVVVEHRLGRHSGTAVR